MLLKRPRRCLMSVVLGMAFGQAGFSAGGAPPMGSYNLYEVKNEKANSLYYTVVSQAEAGGAANNTTDEQGNYWRLVSTFSTKVKADERKAELERENLVWGVFKVKSPVGDERYVAERVSKNHPKTSTKGGEKWTLMKKCDTEEKAREAVAKESEKGKK